jgi:SAM-dependent methyltransferase
MGKEENYIDINKQAWNIKTQYHVDSAFYNMEAFMRGKSSLAAIELGLLGDVKGKSILHLQCHFGQDTISLARMGALATGVDFSDAAIAKAKQIASDTGVTARFICCDIYDLYNNLEEEFDIVFASYGTIGWLPDMDKWAGVVSKFLKPGGRFIFVEFHPVVWMFDYNFEKVHYNYFKADAIIETDMGTYADVAAPIQYDTVSWNHSLSEVITALLGSGLTIEAFNEYDYSPYNCFNNMEEFEPGKYRVAALGNKLPMVYSIVAGKIAN